MRRLYGLPEEDLSRQTITLATASMFSSQNDYVSGTYSINNGETMELAKGANVIDLNEGEPEQYHVTMPEQFHMSWKTAPKKKHHIVVKMKITK